MTGMLLFAALGGALFGALTTALGMMLAERWDAWRDDDDDVWW